MKVPDKTRKRSRPRTEVVFREPDGRHSQTKAQAGSLAIAARASHHAGSQSLARDPRSKTFLGYLNMLGPADGLSARQYQAAQNFLALHADYLRSRQAVPADRLTGSQTASQPGSPEHPQCYATWCRTVDTSYRDCRRAIQATQNESREDLWAAIELCVIQDKRLHHLVGALKLACNALARFTRC